jgi:hypothetical protein
VESVGVCAPSMVGSYSSTKWLWMSWMVKQLFPTPPPPTTTSLYSRRNCDDHGQRMSWFKRQRCTVARGGVPMALTGGRRWSMHTFDAISEDEVVRGERMRRARAFRKSRETQRRATTRAMQGARLQQGGGRGRSGARQVAVGWCCCVCYCRRPRLEWTMVCGGRMYACAGAGAMRDE